MQAGFSFRAIAHPKIDPNSGKIIACGYASSGLCSDDCAIVPSIGNWERLERGLPHFAFDTTFPVYLGVLPRRQGATAKDIRWFTRATASPAT
jgi:hypothetical protein